jgi:hypothetical protein
LSKYSETEKEDYIKLATVRPPGVKSKLTFFDNEWSANNYAAKKDYFTQNKNTFTCEYGQKTGSDLAKAGNRSECCRVTLWNGTDVWEAAPCKEPHEVVWSMIPGQGETLDEHRLRVSIVGIAVTVAIFRLLEEMLAAWVSWEILYSEGLLLGVIIRGTTRLAFGGLLVGFYSDWLSKYRATSVGVGGVALDKTEGHIHDFDEAYFICPRPPGAVKRP